MRRYIKNIFPLLVAVLLTSCVKELELAPSMSDSELATLVPRVKSFTNQYITKASYQDNEKNIKNLSVLVFDNDGNIVDTQTGTTTVTINKTMLKKNVTAATIVMFANISLDDIKDANGNSIKSKTNLTLAEVDNYTCHFDESKAIITSLDNFDGFPMMGIQENVNLEPTTTQQPTIQVDLKILYAKINFEIRVAASSENANVHDNAQTFTLTRYSVNNVSTSTSLAAQATGAATASTSYTTNTVTGSASGSVTPASTQPLKFTFYVAESRYNHNLANLNGIYPSDEWLTSSENDDVKNYSNLTDEQKELSENKLNGVKYLYDDLIQQYKPKLANVDGALPGKGLATYVTVSGTYIDYRGTSWTVNYKVYLGKDNAQNFHVDRNSEYTNILTIKGIRNNDSYGTGDVWIDHRVDVSTNDLSKHITITRETLIDSHIEVRPLRVKWESTNYGFARIYMPYYTENNGQTWSQRDETSSKKNWIGIELNDKTGSLYCSANNETTKGKRKYFTDALISELNTPSINTDIVAESGQDKFIVLSNNECAWIYIDEYIYQESSSTIATSNRIAKIVVDFCTISNNGDLIVNGSEEYILHQQPLIQINNKYYLENYEEYLHSYDSHDKYNIETPPTDYIGPGLEWGKSNRMSKSQFVTKKLVSDWSDWAPTNNEAYDFMHATDAAAESLNEFVFVDNNGNNLDLSKNTGVGFTYNATENNGISISSMGEMPESAYQYCLSKNKFIEGADGESHKMKVSWYVPDVYELSEIFESSNSPLSNDSFYWSSQAPYDITQSNILSATIASERTSEARVVSKAEGIGTKERPEKHRIRCLYSFDGKEADMSDRTPEGIGGLIKIPMTVAGEGFFDYDSWFTNLGTKTTDYPDPKPTYRFPMGDTYTSEEASIRSEADSDFGATWIDGVHYYAKYPLDMNNWGKVDGSIIRLGVYYSMIHPNKWPGLTSKNTTPIAGGVLESLGSLAGQDALATLETTDKMIERSVTTRSGKKIESMPSNVNAVPLDHNEESEDNLTIAFNKGANSSNTPKYEYYSEDGTAARQQKWAKYWNVPTYEAVPKNSPSKTHPAAPQPVTYTVTEVESAITRAMNGLLGGLNLDSENCELQTYTHTPVTTSSIYSYQTSRAAEDAGKEYFNNFINENKEYSTHSVSTSSQEVVLCEYTYTYDKYEREWQNGSI